MGLAFWCGASWSVALRSRQAEHHIIADRREGFQRHVTAVLDDPFLGLLHQDRADQSPDRGLVGELGGGGGETALLRCDEITWRGGNAPPPPWYVTFPPRDRPGLPSLSRPDVQEVEPEAEDHPEQRRPIARCDGVRWWPYPVYQRHDHCHDAEQRPKIEQEGAHHSPSPQLISSRTSAN
ncbi:hypothetical protein SDC9_48665 [bioreactor metagenome]|uniref:Uncharacterized protein n=1 Tax=bioreactor metagenome TaxID=1076179 RepID=A0A644WEY9_9ZZZZ